jgi:hypothetical protein
MCLVGSLVFVSQGVIQNLKPYTTVELIEPQTVQVTGADGKTTTQTVTQQVIAQGPVASQEVIKEFGTNGGGFFGANSAAPFRKSNAVFKLFPTRFDFRYFVCAYLHPRTYDRFRTTWVGGVGGHGASVFGRSNDGVLG